MKNETENSSQTKVAVNFDPNASAEKQFQHVNGENKEQIDLGIPDITISLSSNPASPTEDEGDLSLPDITVTSPSTQTSPTKDDNPIDNSVDTQSIEHSENPANTDAGKSAQSVTENGVRTSDGGRVKKNEKQSVESDEEEGGEDGEGLFIILFICLDCHGYIVILSMQ